MKKIVYFPEGLLLFIKKYSFLLLMPFIFQSCFMTEMLESSDGELQTSVDMCRQTYSGVSYDSPQQSSNNVGFNLGVILMTSPGGTTKNNSAGSQTMNNNDFGSPGNFYASLSNDPSIFHNNSQNMSLETSEMELSNSPSGFLSHMFYSGGIEFIQKKSKYEGTKITLDYMEVPLYALYQINSSSQGNFFGGLGPYFAYGIGGNSESSFGGQTLKTKSFDKTNGYKPFDAGIGLTAGYKMTDSFSFSLAYELGLTNIDRNAFGDKTKNSGISLNIRYPLDKLIK